jgi:hypothetical protein
VQRETKEGRKNDTFERQNKKSEHVQTCTRKTKTKERGAQRTNNDKRGNEKKIKIQIKNKINK